VAWLLVGSLVIVARPAHAQAQETVNIAVDGAAAGAPLERVWAFHGYDEINYTTTPEGRALLGAIVAAHTAPVHVRSHFLFNTGDGTPAMKWGSTNVYAEDAAGNPTYDWTLTDGIMDTLTAVGAFPFVELGFMPKALSVVPSPYRNASTIALNGGCFYPPTDYQRWAGLIREWAAHVDGRYADVSGRWLWELWNEPDIGYWHGTFEDYARLYDFTEAALHAVLPCATLGGPAVARADGDFLTRFLEHCATGSNAVTGATGTRLDLVTFHAKGGVQTSDGHVQMDLGNQLRLHRSGFAAVAAFPQFARLPIYITEADPDGCAACASADDAALAYRQSTAYGAYEAAMMKHTLELAEALEVKLGGLLTWAFTFPGTPYFAGYRALATNGIDLPVFGAFKLLGRLSGTRLPVSSSGARPLGDILENGVRGEPEVDGLAAREPDLIRILLWNYHDDIVAAQATPVRLSIRLPASFGRRAAVSHLRVDDEHGDAYTVWASQGRPTDPSAAQVAALQQSMVPSAPVPDKAVAVGGDGSVVVALDLPRFALSLVTISPAPDGTATDTEHPARGCTCVLAGRGGRGRAATMLGIGWLGWTFATVFRRRRQSCRSTQKDKAGSRGIPL
jgi:xylan 1,4-beta-xylosidase